jgi:Peptidase M76 family
MHRRVVRETPEIGWLAGSILAGEGDRRGPVCGALDGGVVWGDCEEMSSGGGEVPAAVFDPTRRRIVVCRNRLRVCGEQRDFRDSLVHEMVHAYDLCRLEGAARRLAEEQKSTHSPAAVAAAARSSSALANADSGAPVPALDEEGPVEAALKTFLSCDFRACTEIRAARTAECRFDPNPSDCVRMSAWRSTRPVCPDPLMTIRRVWDACFEDRASFVPDYTAESAESGGQPTEKS